MQSASVPKVFLILFTPCCCEFSFSFLSPLELLSTSVSNLLIKAGKRFLSDNGWKTLGAYRYGFERIELNGWRCCCTPHNSNKQYGYSLSSTNFSFPFLSCFAFCRFLFVLFSFYFHFSLMRDLRVGENEIGTWMRLTFIIFDIFVGCYNFSFFWTFLLALSLRLHHNINLH